MKNLRLKSGARHSVALAKDGSPMLAPLTEFDSTHLGGIF